jgi:ligand-binding SRPBCC domain-containing protein
MPTIRVETRIEAPVERCFDLARDVEVHRRSLARTGERAVGGVTTGLLGPGDTVTWEGRHFGVRQRLTARIAAFERPHRFVDEQVSGAFKGFTHVHEFLPLPGGTLMVDTFRYTSPLGWFGVLADRLFLERYMRRFLAERAAHLKRAAEAAS